MSELSCDVYFHVSHGSATKLGNLLAYFPHSFEMEFQSISHVAVCFFFRFTSGDATRYVWGVRAIPGRGFLEYHRIAFCRHLRAVYLSLSFKVAGQ